MAAVTASLRRFTPDLPAVPIWPDVASINEQLVQTKYILLLSPDILVTRSWLDKLLATADSDTSIAAIGPTSNAAPAPQRVKQGYRSLKKELQKFAARRARLHRDEWDEVPYLGGFCLLLKSRAVQEVGGLECSLPLSGALWDLYDRLRAQGLKLACARGVYIHHRELTDDEGAGYDDLALAVQAIDQALAAGQAALERGDLEAAAREFARVTQQFPDLAASV